MKKLRIIFLCIFCFSGCSNSGDSDTINYMEAKEKIINEEAILMDVRTMDEYNDNHIEGAVLLSLDDISEDSVSEVVNSKDSVIIVYCQSGNRSHQAYDKLKELGYNNVYDLGSINNWEE